MINGIVYADSKDDPILRLIVGSLRGDNLRVLFLRDQALEWSSYCKQWFVRYSEYSVSSVRAPAAGSCAAPGACTRDKTDIT